MNMHVVIALSVLSVIAISGCTGVPNVFGGDVLTVQTKTVENGVRDVIKVKDVQTIPRSPLLPDQSMLLSFVIENQDAQRFAHVDVDLFNAPTIKDSVSGNYCNDYTALNARVCKPDICGVTEGGCDILPHEEKPINYAGLRTPSQDEIKNIKTDVKLNFKVSYEFDSSLNMLAPAVNMDEIIKRQRNGERTDLAITKSYSSGPVQIDAEIQGAQYIISNVGGTTPQSVILFTLYDRGSGDLEDSEIKHGNMRVYFPSDLQIHPSYTDDTCPGALAANDKFCCIHSASSGRWECTNNRVKDGQPFGDIALYLKESRSSIRFAVSTVTPLIEPFRTLQITSDVDYLYELRGAADVSINPFQNV